MACAHIRLLWQSQWEASKFSLVGRPYFLPTFPILLNAAELIGHGPVTQGLGMAAAELGQMVTQVGSAKALWQQAEEDQGMP